MSSVNDRDVLAHALRADMPVKDGRVDLEAMMGILMSRLDEVQRQAFIEKMSHLDRFDFAGRSAIQKDNVPVSQRLRIVLN